MTRHLWAAMALASLGCSGCELIIGSLSDCTTDSDCASKGTGLVCTSGLCVSGGGGPGADGGPDGGCLGANQCYSCAPTTNAQLITACTSATCIPFDDSMLTLLPDGGLPPVPGVLDAGPPFDAGPFPADSGLDCSDLGVPAVYVVGSNAAAPFLAALGQALFADTTPLAMVYQNIGSCTAVEAILNGDTVIGPAVYWDSSGAQQSCSIGSPIHPDLGISDAFPGSCLTLLQGLPANVGDIFGPIQTMNFVVPTASSQKSISAAAAYFVYGFAGASGVPPWTDQSHIYNRNPQSGTQLVISAGIGVAPGDFLGNDTQSNGKMISDVAGSSSPESTIGILSSIQITQSVGLTLRPLAFKEAGESCGYLPDSTATSHDKQNVRDGHYALWGPIHFLATLDSNGYILSPNGKRVMGYITGIDPPPGTLDLVQVEAASNLIPTCAMHVTRSQEIGPLESYQPPSPCSCYYENIATGQTACQKCNSVSDCPAGTVDCNLGYCEP